MSQEIMSFALGGIPIVCFDNPFRYINDPPFRGLGNGQFLNYWRDFHGSEHLAIARADLKGTDLRDMDLTDTNLVGANLQGVDLRGANLVDEDLRGANLRGADLTRSIFVGTNLTNATGVEWAMKSWSFQAPPSRGQP